MQTDRNDDRTLDRIRWHSRRGLLENDLLLTRFLDAELDELSATDLKTLEELLLLGDNDLLDLLMGRKISATPALDHMVGRIRAARAPRGSSV